MSRDFGSVHCVVIVRVQWYHSCEAGDLVHLQTPGNGIYIRRGKADGFSSSLWFQGWKDYVHAVAAHMVQVSHIGFPDLAGTLDYSTQWRRKEGE